MRRYPFYEETYVSTRLTVDSAKIMSLQGGLTAKGSVELRRRGRRETRKTLAETTKGVFHPGPAVKSFSKCVRSGVVAGDSWEGFDGPC